MPKRRTSVTDGLAAVAAYRAGDVAALATAVRFLLEDLAERMPGKTVEVRVPPFGAVQCVAGPAHTRGTPPNVVELSPEVWFELATGSIDWQQAMATHEVQVSGVRASEIANVMPLVRLN